MSSKKHNKNQVAKNQVIKKKRGTALTIALIIIVLHGAAAAIAYSSMSTGPDVQRPWIISMFVIHFLANIVAAIGIFLWKKWGISLYAASSILGVVAGALGVGLWSIFYLILPLVILGYIVKSKLKFFS
jgi:hypothetical protein